MQSRAPAAWRLHRISRIERFRGYRTACACQPTKASIAANPNA
jgi:hypothetical protein